MELQFLRTFKKEYEKLPTPQKRAFDDRITLFIENPRHPLLRIHKLRGEYRGCRSLNITGDVRAIFYIKNEIVAFMRIGTHAELYEE